MRTNRIATRLLNWLHERNTIKLHVQFFLRMNTRLFEICGRKYNEIKPIIIKGCILLVLITNVSQNARFKNRKIFSAPNTGALDLDNYEETLTEVFI